MKVLLSSASFLPNYGGPAYSVRYLADRLVQLGLDVGVWAPDGSSNYPIVPFHPEACGEATALQGSLREVLSTFGTPDVFHDSGLWWHHNLKIAGLARRLGKPVVVSVRGMLEPAALRHRAWRKRLAWHLYQRRDLERSAALHVTGSLEAEHVRALGLTTPIVSIPNGLSVPQHCPLRDPMQRKRVLFLGRIHPIKGLPMLVEAWARIRPPDWTLEIAGPDEGRHRRALEDQVRALELEGSVCFAGPVRGTEKKALFARASVFALPSHSESFGVAAGEALAEGLPVIATHGTPWAVLRSEDCGWHVPASVSGLEGGLRSAFEVPREELVAMGQRGHRYVSRAFSWDHVASEMATLYQRILA
jgi:glycosyltransferase involved in cell wall biosynthesis